MKKTLVILLIALFAVPLFAQAVTEVRSGSDGLRIISLAPNVTEIIYALGAGDQLVGRTDYCNYPEEALAVTSVGTLWDPNLEAILALNADVAIASSIVDPSFIESLQKAGVTAYQFYEEESLEGTFALILNVAITIGREDKGLEIVDSLKNRINAVKDKTSGIPEDQRKSAVYIISYGDWGDYAATGETYLNDVIEAAGGINAAKDGAYWSISKELLLSQDPDVVLLGAYSYTDPAYEIATFSSLEPYSQLTASKTGKVFTINGDAAERQGIRTADTVEEIAAILYPELF
ncbi:MAG: ABC transporter substrate-binding protein [bacterium]|jgi:iron complex transport system substrate-binding protein|nr:ABC transporter substrate-binding protein [bacterium]